MSLLQRLRQGLDKTRSGFIDKLDALLSRGPVDAGVLEELEDLLITSDFGVETTGAILEDARRRCKQNRKDPDFHLRDGLREVIRERLEAHQTPLDLTVGNPHVILVVGVNGVGKTTTIGKLACLLGNDGHRVMLAAGDTFRAAAVEQLQIWGERAGCPVIAQGQDADAASVLFDAHAAASARGCDLLIGDTAGRLHTKVNLMEELKKIKRVLGRRDPQAPHDIWLVLDATTGQNAISQVRQFHEAMALTGLIVTKLDGTARGGVIVGIADRFGLPIRYIGVGEGLDDLKPFAADAFVEALFGR
ncbi:MAG: signal recognition particle-docking protein FtsY [Magnetococcales bacterium]|nr:signal recognition particle-docking protein FtsY [Magnetococcales bacterium]